MEFQENTPEGYNLKLKSFENSGKFSLTRRLVNISSHFTLSIGNTQVASSTWFFRNKSIHKTICFVPPKTLSLSDYYETSCNLECA